MQGKHIFWKIILPLLLAILALLLIIGLFFIWKFNKTEKKIIFDQSGSTSIISTLKDMAMQKDISLDGYAEGRINMLFLGIAGQNKPGQYLTDTILLLSLDTKTNRVAFLSLPRDLYVEVPDENRQTKINSLYQYGLLKNNFDENIATDPIKKTIAKITSLDIHYWAVLDFEGFEKAIDAIGGINIMNERDIYDARFPGPNYSYETFELKKGLHLLNGENALKYARLRHGDPEGDFGRAARQQQVLQAAKNRIFSTGTLLNIRAVNELFETLGNNLKTNLQKGDLGEFLKLFKKLDTANISGYVINAWDKDSLLKVSHINSSSGRIFILIPRAGSWSEVQDTAQNIFDLNTLEKRRALINEENTRVVIINQSDDATIVFKIKDLLKKNFGYKNVVALSGSQKNLTEKTVACDLTQGQKPFTLDELVKKVPAVATYDLSAKNRQILSNIQADIVLVVGKNLVERYNMEEDSFEDYRNAKDTNEYLEFREK